MKIRRSVGRRWTLVELLLGLVLMLLLLGMSLPALGKWIQGSELEQATIRIQCRLRQIRGLAVQSRRPIALVMPGQECPVAEYRRVAFRACYVDAHYGFEDWVGGSSWELLPAGACIRSISMSKSPTAADGCQLVAVPLLLDSGETRRVACRVVIYKPNGRLASLQRYLCFAVDKNGVPDASHGYRLLRIDQYAGNAKVE
jgi:hypothetical protein